MTVGHQGGAVDFAQLETFLAVARHLSFTRAARELHLTQSGVSRQLQRLERELGASLFVRSRSAVALTPAGQRARLHAEAMLEQRRQLLAGLGVAHTLAGRLRIAASTTPGEFLVPTLLAGFTARHPRVRPEVQIADSAAVIEELRAKHCDLAFVGARVPGRLFQFDPVADDEIVLAVPAEHPFASRRTIPLDALTGQPFIEREDGSGTLASVRGLVAARGLRLPDYRVVMVLGTTDAVVTAVERGYGMGWVSSLALATRDAARLATVRLEELELHRPLYLARERRRDPHPVTDAFVDWVLHHGSDPLPGFG